MSLEIDYELEKIRIELEANNGNALFNWQNTFDASRNRWQNDRARRLLQILKTGQSDDRLLRIVKYYEATLLVNLGEWKRAQESFEASISLCRNVGDSKGELRALNGFANLLRRNAEHLDRAVEVFDSALSSDFPESSKIILLNGRGLLLYEKGDLDHALACFQDVFELATRSGDMELSASVLHNMGSVAWTRGRLQDADDLLRKALALQQRTQNIHGEAETLNSLGLVQEGVGRWEEAIETYKLALHRMEQTGDFYGQSQVLVNLGNIYSLRNEFDRAISCLEPANEIAKELGNPRLQGQVLTALGDAYRIGGELEQAMEALLQAVDIKTKSGEARSLKHNWLSLGATYHQLKQPQAAQTAYEKALEIARGQNDHRMVALILLNLSSLFTAQEKYDDAIPFLVEAKALALNGEYHDCLAWIYEQEGDLELLGAEPDAARILETYSIALWHACQFNMYELGNLIQRLGRFWLANAEDGKGDVSLWFCDSIIQLWRDVDKEQKCTTVTNEFAQLRERITELMNNGSQASGANTN